MKVLAKGTGKLSRAAQIHFLLATGLWDEVSMIDRQAWIERGEVLDTPGGRLLFDFLKRLGVFNK